MATYKQAEYSNKSNSGKKASECLSLASKTKGRGKNTSLANDRYGVEKKKSKKMHY